MDLSEREFEIHERIIQTAEQWCKEYFRQPWVQIREVCEIPTEYPGNTFGYRVIVSMPDYPHGEAIDILVAPDGSMSGLHIP
jgi:hypothetical protein